MNAHHRHAIADSSDFRVVTGPIVGNLLGPEWIIAALGKRFRVGALTVSQLRSGIPAEDLDMLEVDPDTYEAIE